MGSRDLLPLLDNYGQLLWDDNQDFIKKQTNTVASYHMQEKKLVSKYSVY